MSSSTQARRALCCLAVVATVCVIASPAHADLRVFEMNRPDRREPPPERPTGPELRLVPTPQLVDQTPPPPETDIPDETPPETGTPPESTVEETPDGAEPSGEPGVDETDATSPETGATPSEAAPSEAPDQAVQAAAPTEAPPARTALDDLLDDYRWLDLTAFFQPGFIARLGEPRAGNTEDTFWLQRARFGFRAQLFDWLQARMEIEFTSPINPQDLYLDFTFHPAFNVRFGQFLIPTLRAFSFNELNLAFIDRPLYAPMGGTERQFLNFLSPRDLGFMVWGLIGDISPTAKDPVFEYQFGGFIGRGIVADNSDQAFLWALRVQLHTLGVPDGASRENDLARNHHARLGVAASVYNNCDDSAYWNRGLTIDAELRYEGLYMSGAVLWFRNGVANEPLSDALGYRQYCGPGQDPAMPRTDPDFVSRGAHYQVQYVLPRFLQGTGAPFEWFDLELMLRWDIVDTISPYSDSDPLFGGGTNTPGYSPPNTYSNRDPREVPIQWRLTFGLNFYPTGQQNLRLGINYQLNREEENVVTSEGEFVGVENDVFWIQITAGI